MTQMVTRCPKCATAFRITSTQLESAKGAVRCGSCLHIFKAQDYLVKSTATETAETPKSPTPKTEPVKTEPPKAAPKPAPAKAEQLTLDSLKPNTAVEKPAAPAKPLSTAPAAAIAATQEPEKNAPKPVIDKAKVLEDEEDVLISDDMDQVEKDSTYEFDGFIDIDMHPKQTVSLFEREIRYEAPLENESEEIEDESWAEELLDEDEPAPQFKKPAPVAPPVAQAEAKPKTNSPTEPDTKSSSEHYAGPVFSLVTDTSEETREEPIFSEEFLNATRPTNTAPRETQESDAFAAALFNQSPVDETSEDEEEDEKPNSKRPVKSSKMRAFDTSRAALLMNIMPAPVEFTAKRMRRWYQRKLWSTLSILMAVLMFFQVAYFKFDYFSRVEPYRTAYLFTCPVFGCEVPTLIDTAQILATNLIVRNHPDIENALMVDAILINNASFEQPFPNLVLSFSKLDETPVATRQFTPKEYLAGELAGMQYIPVRQPVHITLEISDPGPDAVNYSLLTH